MNADIKDANTPTALLRDGLMSTRHYGGGVDIWGVSGVSVSQFVIDTALSIFLSSCVLGEMFTRRPILPGTSDLDQLEKIWQLYGTPH